MEHTLENAYLIFRMLLNFFQANSFVLILCHLIMFFGLLDMPQMNFLSH